MAPDKKTASASKTTPPNYTAWNDAAAAELIERHGIRANVRERTWRNFYIRKLSPGEAADRTAADYDATRPERARA